MAKPVRVQQRRTRGWRKPPGARSVARGTIYGNPYRVTHAGRRRWTVTPEPPRHGHVLAGCEIREPVGGWPVFTDRRAAHHWAVARFERHLVEGNHRPVPFTGLRGIDLMCWCDPDMPCHADVLLDWANRCTWDGCPHWHQAWSVTLGTRWEVIDLTDAVGTGAACRRIWDRFHVMVRAGATIRPATAADIDTMATLVAQQAELGRNPTPERVAAVLGPTPNDQPMF